MYLQVYVRMYAGDICTFHRFTHAADIFKYTREGGCACVRAPLYVCEKRLDAGAGSHGDDSFGLAAASTWIPYVDPRSRPPALTYYPPPSITPLVRSFLSYSLVRGPPPPRLRSPLSFFSCPFHRRAPSSSSFPVSSYVSLSPTFLSTVFHLPTWELNRELLFGLFGLRIVVSEFLDWTRYSKFEKLCRFY